MTIDSGMSTFCTEQITYLLFSETPYPLSSHCRPLPSPRGVCCCFPAAGGSSERNHVVFVPLCLALSLGTTSPTGIQVPQRAGFLL